MHSFLFLNSQLKIQFLYILDYLSPALKLELAEFPSHSY